VFSKNKKLVILMIDLKNSGLNLKFDEKRKLLFLDKKKLKPDIRYLNEIKGVLYERKIKGNKKLYLMYRDIAKTKGFLKNSLRYDVTVIFPGKIGKEYIKTAGHYHPEEGYQVSYPEVYEVLHGEAHVIIEKINEKNEVIDNYLIFAEKGDKILIPPNYGHITINTTDGPLIMANLVERTFKSNYKPIKQKHGASYYIIDDDGLTLIKNHHYKKVPEFDELVPKDILKLGLSRKVPLFKAAKRNPEKFLYLKEPHKYLKDFRKYFK
jgi:glucose-6-phosphate isomerase, archaeal